MLLRGIEHQVPYSISRWTDVPAGKWPWFLDQLKQGWMLAVDQRTSVPARWSLDPKDTVGLIFWTKNPANLIRYHRVLAPYKLKIHVTLTGWEEVENRAPSLDEGIELLTKTIEAFGPHQVVWRFSPIPDVPDVVSRFEKVVKRVPELNRVFVSFLQDNDRMGDRRTGVEKEVVLNNLRWVANDYGIKVLMCNEQQGWGASGVCAPPSDFGLGSKADSCGCAFVVDPFSYNESCVYGCTYCYASDKSLSPRTRNTTLKVLR